MAMAGGEKASIHFQGAAKIFRTGHNAVCECDRHTLCPRRSSYAPNCSEVALINGALRNIGVDHRLLEAYTPEDEAAVATRL
jgi:hypothetical protein